MKCPVEWYVKCQFVMTTKNGDVFYWKKIKNFYLKFCDWDNYDLKRHHANQQNDGRKKSKLTTRLSVHCGYNNNNHYYEYEQSSLVSAKSQTESKKSKTIFLRKRPIWERSHNAWHSVESKKERKNKQMHYIYAFRTHLFPSYLYYFQKN